MNLQKWLRYMLLAHKYILTVGRVTANFFSSNNTFLEFVHYAWM